jgi:hypothetical protein
MATPRSHHMGQADAQTYINSLIFVYQNDGEGCQPMDSRWSQLQCVGSTATAHASPRPIRTFHGLDGSWSQAERPCGGGVDRAPGGWTAGDRRAGRSSSRK